MNNPDLNRIFAEIAGEKGYEKAGRHIFLCTGNSCASQERNLQLWEYLKKKCAALNANPNTIKLMRTKADCLRICAYGPLAVMYPEAVFFAQLDEHKIDKLFEGLSNGKIPSDLVTYQLSNIVKD